MTSGSAFGFAGSWVDVSWAEVALNIGQTYFIRSSSLENVVVAAASGNPYASGLVYYDFSPQPSYDLAFRTFANDASPAPVPEPAAWTMFIAGFGLVGGAMRPRQKATVAYG